MHTHTIDVSYLHLRLHNMSKKGIQPNTQISNDAKVSPRKNNCYTCGYLYMHLYIYISQYNVTSHHSTFGHRGVLPTQELHISFTCADSASPWVYWIPAPLITPILLNIRKHLHGHLKLGTNMIFAISLHVEHQCFRGEINPPSGVFIQHWWHLDRPLQRHQTWDQGTHPPPAFPR